ncbi:MAG: 2Fe-2S iron-sulfur cluster-binding protein [Vicinamibacterales bacterium]
MADDQPAPLETLARHLAPLSAEDWRRAVETLSASIHEVDRNATRIWFSFYPLELCQAFEQSDDHVTLARRLELMGRWRLADQVDESHRFLFAHRYWPQVKSAIETFTGTPPEPLAALVTAVADAAARTARVDREMLLGMTLVGLMTLRQAGPEAFAAAPGRVHLTDAVRARSPHQVMRARARDDFQGPLGFLRGIRRTWTVTFDESDPEARFTVINGQELASGAQSDKRDYHSRDPRCTPNEGPIPVECRAASCGTCWVGVLGGAEKLSPVVARDEGRRMKVFGYLDSEEPRPLVRLACQATASGAVSIVIPPWNGMVGKIRGIN